MFEVELRSWIVSKLSCSVRFEVESGHADVGSTSARLTSTASEASSTDCAKAQGITDGDAEYYAYCEENDTHYCGPVNANGNSVCHGANYCNGKLLENACLQYDS